MALGHTRLSITDLTGGHQPLRNEDGAVHAVVNGEFYQFAKIRSELEARSHCFRSHSDSEILLHLYEDLGTDCLSRLRGEFAFVLWDVRRHTLFAARDRFGIKPLFYSRLNGLLVFASEVKALHALGVAAAWDQQGFFEAVTLDASLAGRTLFRDVSELLPGQYLLADANGVTIRTYWDFNYPLADSTQPSRSDDEYAHEFLELLDEAVRIRLRAEVRVGCYLSGGIDSSSILALMSRHARNPVPAFTVAFDEASCDESPLARDEARRIGACFHSVLVTEKTLAADFGPAVWHTESLFTNAHGVAKFALSRAAREAGVTVVLTGEGADEILGGYPFVVKDAIRFADPITQEHLRKSLGMTVNELAGLLKPRFAAAPPTSLVERLGYVPAWIEGREWFLHHLRPVLPDSFESDPIYRRLLDSLDVSAQLSGRDIVNQNLYLYSKTALRGYILTVLGDRMEMAHSIEGRLPFLDHHLVQWTRELPPNQKVRGAAEKFILRKAMRDVLPPALCARRKQAFRAPSAWRHSHGPLYHLVQDSLRGNALSRVPWLEKSAVIDMLDRAEFGDPASAGALDQPLITIVSACALAERFRL